jgi:hypothetical protein
MIPVSTRVAAIRILRSTFPRASPRHAAVTNRDRYGEQAALYCVIGEKLLHFAGAARKDPDLARQFLSFVARVRQMFARDVILRYLGKLETRPTEKCYEVDPEDMTLASGSINDLESLKQLADLLRADELGTA